MRRVWEITIQILTFHWNQSYFLCFVVDQYELIECKTVTIFQVVAFWWLKHYFVIYCCCCCIWWTESIALIALRWKGNLHGMRKKKARKRVVFRSINGISDEETTEMNRCKYLCGDGGSGDGDGDGGSGSSGGRLMRFHNVKEFPFWYILYCVTSRK